MRGTLFVVATPIGNLEDITLRALRVLGSVAVIAAEDTRRTAHLLARHAITTPTTSLHEHNEARKSAALVGRLEAGEDVALVSDAGSPTIADPGHRLINLAIGAGLRVEPIPGPNAAITALMASGFEASTFLFLGFPPNRGKPRKLWLSRLAAARGTVVFYEAPHRILSTLRDILEVVGDRPVVLARELTKIHESLVRGPITSVIDLVNEKGEFTVVIDIGLLTERESALVGRTAEIEAVSRRGAVASLARSLGLSPNDVYSALELVRKSGL